VAKNSFLEKAVKAGGNDMPATMEKKSIYIRDFGGMKGQGGSCERESSLIPAWRYRGNVKHS
jgi:hypothetical protein